MVVRDDADVGSNRVVVGVGVATFLVALAAVPSGLSRATGFLVAAAILVAIVTFYGWLRATRWAVNITYTDNPRDLKAEHRSRQEIPVGHETLICVRIRTNVPITFSKIDVRPRETAREWNWPSSRWRHRPHRIHKKPSQIAPKIVGLTDVNKTEFNKRQVGAAYPRQFAVSLPPEDDLRGLAEAEFVPAWQVAVRDAVLLGITVYASDEWSGLLTLRIPNGLGYRVWRDLPLVARKREGSDSSTTPQPARSECESAPMPASRRSSGQHEAEREQGHEPGAGEGFTHV
jgi:hypothetical protein